MSEWRILIRDLNYTTPGFMPLALRTPVPFHTISMKRTTSFQRSSSPRPGTLSRLTQDILTAQASVDGKLRHEKLSVRKECALLLPWVTKHTQTKDLEIDWDEYLPAFNSNRNLERETPLLEETAGEALVNHKQTLPGLGQKLDPVHDHVRGSGDADLPDGLRDSVDVAMAKIKNEKLHCSKESLRLIQKTTSSTSLTPKDLHELWDTVRVEVSCWTPWATGYYTELPSNDRKNPQSRHTLLSSYPQSSKGPLVLYLIRRTSPYLRALGRKPGYKAHSRHRMDRLAHHCMTCKNVI